MCLCQWELRLLSRTGSQGTQAGAPTEQCQHFVKQTTPPKIQAHFPDTAEMLSPAHREIDGVFGLPVSFRGGECVYVI